MAAALCVYVEMYALLNIVLVCFLFLFLLTNTQDQYLFVHRALLTYMSRNSSSTANTRESSAPDDTEQIEASNEAVEGDHSETKLL